MKIIFSSALLDTLPASLFLCCTRDPVSTIPVLLILNFTPPPQWRKIYVKIYTKLPYEACFSTAI